MSRDLGHDRRTIRCVAAWVRGFGPRRGSTAATAGGPGPSDMTMLMQSGVPSPIASPARNPSGKDQAALVEHLLRAAVDAKVERAKNLLGPAVEAAIPFARDVAARYRGRGIEPDDLDQIALEHLVKAARNYRPSADSDFRSYAVPVIRGGIRHHFRDRAWSVRLPRRLQDLQALVTHPAPQLAIELGGWPRYDEIAAALDVEVDEVIEAEAARGFFQPDSLSTPITADSALTIGEL